MYLMGSRFRSIVMATALAMITTGTGLPPAAAQSPAPAPFLAQPNDASLAADAAVVVTDVPGVPEGPPDLTAVVQEAVTTAGALPAAEWEVEALAATLDGDPLAAFRTVRDRISFEPYPGILRAGEGALVARGGNAFDRAMLLKGLLDAMGVTARYAVGVLDEATAGRLAARALEAVPEPLQAAGGLAATTMDVEAISARARRDHAQLRHALDASGMDIGTDVADDPVADVRSHAWVQMLQDGDWVDLDPSMADAEPGQRMTEPTMTADVMPADAWQRITFQLEVETLADGSLVRLPVLEWTGTAAGVADSEVFLYFQPDTGGGGGLLFGGGSDEGSFLPLLMIDGEVTSGEPFSVLDESGGDGGFGLGGGGGGSAFAGLWLSMISEAPGVEPMLTTIPILDRVPDGARATGTLGVDDLAVLPASDAGPLAMGTIRHLMLSTGGKSPRASAIERADAVWWAGTELMKPEGTEGYSLADLLWPVAVADDTITVAAERLLIPGITDPGSIAPVIARPRLVIAALGADQSGPDLVQLEIDIVQDAIRLVVSPTTDARDIARSRLWYGALGSALETEVMRQSLAIPDTPGVGLESTSVAMRQPLTVLTDAGLPRLSMDAPWALRTALEAGLIAVIPGDPTTSDAWWTIAPDGTTRAVLAPDGGAARGRGIGPLNSGGGTRPQPPSQGKVWEIDPPKRRPPPIRGGRGDCRGGNEYIAIIGCVSAPTALVIQGVAMLIITASAFRIISAIRG